jgi:hypothetical protein
MVRLRVLIRSFIEYSTARAPTTRARKDVEQALGAESLIELVALFDDLLPDTSSTSQMCRSGWTSSMAVAGPKRPAEGA